MSLKTALSLDQIKSQANLPHELHAQISEHLVHFTVHDKTEHIAQASACADMSGRGASIWRLNALYNICEVVSTRGAPRQKKHCLERVQNHVGPNNTPGSRYRSSQWWKKEQFQHDLNFIEKYWIIFFPDLRRPVTACTLTVFCLFVCLFVRQKCFLFIHYFCEGLVLVVNHSLGGGGGRRSSRVVDGFSDTTPCWDMIGGTGLFGMTLLALSFSSSVSFLSGG